MPNNHAAQQNGCKKPQSSDVAVVMVPLPAQGHLNQLLHLSRLVSARNIPVYYVGAATHIRQARLRVQGWNPSGVANIQFHEFPPTPFENPPPDPNAPTKFPDRFFLHSWLHASPRPVYGFVEEISRAFRRVIVIYDSLMSYVVQDIDSLQNADCYSFRSISAFAVASWEALDSPDLPIEAEILRDIPSLDGYYPPEFAEFLNLQSGTRKIFSGEIYNSCREIEGLFLDLLEKRKRNGAEKLWGIGPFNPVSVPEERDIKNRHKILQWLDRQGRLNSVIFVSFGTTSSLLGRTNREIALVERSGQKFIWVLRDADKGDIFAGEVRKSELPDGFEKRVKERGVVVRDWAPQLEILGHPSTGGFMSHCGWNSCLESISMGVPMATWPMHSDQPGNAVLITKVLKIGVQVKCWSRQDELVSSVTVERAVRKLMMSEEGDWVRKRAAELGDAVRKSVEGGAVRKEMDSFIAHITA
ncbi:Zeatin O-glucosyltransferase [Sesamum alatum]|uniref:Glycosyltransferase n=1 Tax=Sesamum alatum TaxID=300844 RepID=A0AAE1XJ62_9LAMI|nr:Zeatin O-glucosyltransferase [Sesamum alatum]